MLFQLTFKPYLQWHSTLTIQRSPWGIMIIAGLNFFASFFFFLITKSLGWPLSTTEINIDWSYFRQIFPKLFFVVQHETIERMMYIMRLEFKVAICFEGINDFEGGKKPKLSPYNLAYRKLSLKFLLGSCGASC